MQLQTKFKQILYLRIIAALPLFAILACTAAHAETFKNGVELERGGPFPEIRINKLMMPEADAEFMENKLIGESVKSFSLRPEADAVSGATISSTVIFDEVKKTAKLLDMLP